MLPPFGYAKVERAATIPADETQINSGSAERVVKSEAPGRFAPVRLR